MNTEPTLGTIGVAGMSHLGIVSCICWSSLGWQVVGADSDSVTISSLAARELPVHEPRLHELLEDNRARQKFTCDFSLLRECEVVFIALDTETDETNQSVLINLGRLIDQVIPWLGSGCSVILMSQVPVGFTRQLDHTIRVRRPDLNFELYYWVETLVIGNAVERFLTPERIIIGSATRAVAEETSLGKILAAFCCPVLTMSYESAELTKAAINLYLSVSVTFANVLADLCEATGASMKEITPALRSDRRIGEHAYIRPGLGIAGGNLERDLAHLQQLARKSRVDASLIDTVVDLNAKRYHWVQKQLEKHVFAHKTKPKIAVWGLAYKKNTQSTKNSFAVRILRDLTGKADLCAYDPLAQFPADFHGDVSAGDRFEVLNDADCLLVLTDWDEFANTDYSVVANKMRRPLIIDSVDILDRTKTTRQGLDYISIGEPHE